MATETYRPAFTPNTGNPYISYGLSYLESCVEHVTNTFKASKVYIIASRSLSNDTDALQRLQDALSEKVAGVRVGMKSHTYWSEVLEVARACRNCEADLIVTLGAGSLTDAAKIVSLVSKCSWTLA